MNQLQKINLSAGVRLAILAALFFSEKLLLDRFVDTQRVQAAEGLGYAVWLAQHWGFRFLVATLAAVAAFALVKGDEHFHGISLAVRKAKIRVSWILAHLVCVACLMPLTYVLFGAGTTTLPFFLVVTIWVSIAFAAALSAVLAMAGWNILISGARTLGVIWCYAAAAALVSVSVMQLSQELWEPTTALTFELVQRILLLVIPSLSIDPGNRIISTDRFAVQVTEYCSGLEGMGLILAFSVAWLLYFRREYIFPRALLLLPAGLLTMFILNALRISALLMIGHLGSPGVAAYGFHSQAGWIAFNIAACGLVFFSRRSSWLNRSGAQASDLTAGENPTAAYLMPLLAILAAAQISQAMSGRFELFYPIRLVAGLGALLVFRKRLALLDWSWSARGVAVGGCVCFFWIVASYYLLPTAGAPDQLVAASPWMRYLWIAIRFATSTLVVPVAEELAYRGYLMRRIVNEDFESVPFREIRWPTITIAAIVFGLAHGALWLPGIIAGAAFGFISVRRNGIGEAVAAHVTANALIGVYVLAFEQWQLW